MAGFELSRIKELPGLLKPLLFLVLLVFLILMAASSNGAGWWIWMTLIIQFVLIIINNISIIFGLDRVIIRHRTWIVYETIYSCVFVIVNIVNLIVLLVRLITFHDSLFGVGALLCFGMTLLYGLNCMMMYKIWRDNEISSQAPGPGVRPGDTGNMNPGLGSAPGAFPATSAPSTNSSYPSAIPPGATFSSTP